MTKEQVLRRKQIKSEISSLNKNNIEMFKLWCYKKNVVDYESLRKQARENLLKIEQLENEYEQVKNIKTSLNFISGY